jgi:hypothetical protein
MFEKNQKEFDQKGYSIVRSVLSSELRDLITQYALFDEMQNFSAEDPTNAQVLNAHSKYADPAMEALLLMLHPIMEQATGLKLYPTYSYFRVYRNGDDLKIHKDRASCEISSTVCFNYSYDTDQFKWPIFMDGKELFLNPGDMAIYRGCDLNHWREVFGYTDDAWHVQGFFHYVDINGPYAEFKYDKRNSIGEKMISSRTDNPSIKSYILSTE